MFWETSSYLSLVNVSDAATSSNGFFKGFQGEATQAFRIDRPRLSCPAVSKVGDQQQLPPTSLYPS